MERSKKIIESAANEIVGKLGQLDQHIQQLVNQELAIRDQMQRDCQELKQELDQIDTKQRRIQDCLKNIQNL